MNRTSALKQATWRDQIDPSRICKAVLWAVSAVVVVWMVSAGLGAIADALQGLALTVGGAA